MAASRTSQWARWFQAWRTALWNVLTGGGFLFTLAISIVGLAAIASANNLLFLVLAMMLSVLLVSGFVSRLSLAGLELDFVVPEHVSAGRTIAATLAIRNRKSWMPSFSLRVTGVPVGVGKTPAILQSTVYFPIIPGSATIEEPVDVRFARRGQHRQNSFLFSTAFPFGFREKSAEVTLLREVVVYPSIEPQAGFEELLASVTGELGTNLRGTGHDFYRIRPYETFESARYVDWRASAHTGELQVREFSREQDRAVEIFLDRQITHEQNEWFERAIDCCAFLSWHLAQRGGGLRFRSQGFTLNLPETGDIYAILRYLALVTPLLGPQKPVDEPSDPNTFQVIFTPAPQRLEEAGWTPSRVFRPEDGSPSYTSI